MIPKSEIKFMFDTFVKHYESVYTKLDNGYALHECDESCEIECDDCGKVLPNPHFKSMSFQEGMVW